MPTDEEIGFPQGTADERELLLRWLGFLRGAVVRNLDGVDEAGARWTPDGPLLPLLGIVNHLTHVEWRWIDGAMRGLPVSKHESEYRPGPELTVDDAVAAYRARARDTDDYVRSAPSLAVPCTDDEVVEGDLRWVLLHLVNETARHCGHADATRELLDGVTGE